MTETLAKPIKWMPFLALISLVVGSNMILYMTPYFHPITTAVVVGSMVDFLIVLPFLTYYFIIRKRYSWKLTILVAIVSYGLATFIIPDLFLEKVTFIPQLLIVLEAGIILIELYLLTLVCRKLPKVINTFKEFPEDLPFLIKIKQAFNFHFKESRMIDCVVSEISMLYYALFSYRKPEMSSREVFTYHKKTSFVALNLMLVHALIIESIGLHYFFSQINHTVSLILLFINAYSVLFLFGHVQAVKKVPLMVQEQSLLIHIGFFKGMNLPFSAIGEIKNYEGPDMLSNDEKKFTFEAVVSDFIPEKPSIEILLKEPLKADLIYGFKKKVSRVVIKVDEPDDLMNAIQKKLLFEKEFK